MQKEAGIPNRSCETEKLSKSMQGRKICKGEKYTRKKDIEEKLMLLQENENEGNIAGNLVKG